MSILARKTSFITLLSIFLFLFSGTVLAKDCKGMSQSACSSSTSCSWIKGYKTQTGTEVKSYCRNKSGKASSNTKKSATTKPETKSKDSTSSKKKDAKSATSDKKDKKSTDKKSTDKKTKDNKKSDTKTAKDKK